MKCICCGKVLTPLDNQIPEHEQVFDYQHRHVGRTCNIIDINNRSWNNGATGSISAGFGSSHDGGVYAIAVCDECIEKKVGDGTVAYIENNICRTKEVKEDINNHRKIWINNNP